LPFFFSLNSCPCCGVEWRLCLSEESIVWKKAYHYPNPSLPLPSTEFKFMLIWIGFLVLVAALLALDLGVFNKDAHNISAKEAFRWTGVWVSFSLLFSIFIYFAYENHWMHEEGAP